ncbi:ribonuclease [Thermaurantiacus tibetensis]|uniref:ribonuclease n=1 Tax=Thermaurantiacus tibetensis TaxID=2759035 RepID=UPI00188EA74F|nr:ribonuclease [Thermaurantiacus tibetensis]
MAEAFLDERPGETRAAVVEGGAIVAMDVARAFDGIQPGAIVEGRIGPMLDGRATVRLAGETGLLEGPCALPEGAAVRLEVVRAAIPEAGRWRPAKLRLARPGAALAPAPSLAARLRAEGLAVRAGFSEAVAEAWEAHWTEAETGEVRIPGGRLLLSPTPALLAVDIDGRPDPEAAARAVAAVIRRFGIGGSIAVDFPTRPGSGWRKAAAAAFDAAMTGMAYERSAVSGFGLLHVVRPRLRPSLLDRAMFERDRTAALALLVHALRDPRPGPLRLVARPAVIRLLRDRPELVAAVERAAGRPVALVADPAAGDGHVA